MGMYNYICKKCGKNLRQGEVAHLIHVREGKILGECNGHYNGYGGVDEDSVFDKWDYPQSKININGHDEIMKSRFKLPTSNINIEEKRLFIWEKINWAEFIAILKKTLPPKKDKFNADDYAKAIALWATLPICDSNELPTSGIVAYHAKCYHILERKNQVSLTPSESSEDKNFRKPRKEFCGKRDLVMLDNKKE